MSIILAEAGRSWLLLTWVGVSACVGGIFVFWGLAKEAAADKALKNEGLTAYEIVQVRRKSAWGWRILMFGIFVEIVTAAALAIRGEVEIMEVDPLNQPVNSVSAYAILNFRSLNPGKVFPSFPAKRNRRTDCFVELNAGRFRMLSGEGVNWYGTGDTEIFLFSFMQIPRVRSFGQVTGQEAFAEADFTGPVGQTARAVIESLDKLSLDITLPESVTNADITSGSVNVILNGVLLRKFSIAPCKLPGGYGHTSSVTNFPIEIIKAR